MGRRYKKAGEANKEAVNQPQEEKAPDTAQPDREAACCPATSLTSFPRKKGKGMRGTIVSRRHITGIRGIAIALITVMVSEVPLHLQVRKRPKLQNRKIEKEEKPREASCPWRG